MCKQKKTHTLLHQPTNLIIWLFTQTANASISRLFLFVASLLGVKGALNLQNA
jgi:hypothetical protein